MQLFRHDQSLNQFTVLQLNFRAVKSPSGSVGDNFITNQKLTITTFLISQRPHIAQNNCPKYTAFETLWKQTLSEGPNGARAERDFLERAEEFWSNVGRDDGSAATGSRLAPHGPISSGTELRDELEKFVASISNDLRVRASRYILIFGKYLEDIESDFG